MWQTLKFVWCASSVLGFAVSGFRVVLPVWDNNVLLGLTTACAFGYAVLGIFQGFYPDLGRE